MGAMVIKVSLPRLTFPALTELRNTTYSLGISDNSVLTIDISMESSIKQKCPIHKTSFRYLHADLDSIQDFLRDAYWNGIFKLPNVQCATVICPTLKAGVDALIPFQ